MNFKRKSQPLSSFNAAPMNDILFFLLLFFLLTATFAIPTFQKVTLAKAEGTQKLKQNMAVVITQGGKLYIENQEVQSKEFEQRIQSLIKDKTEPVVNVIIDKGATWQDIAPVTGILQKNKVNAILATQKPVN